MIDAEKMVAEWAEKNGFTVRNRGDFADIDAVLDVENGLIRCEATISYSSLANANDPKKDLAEIESDIHRRLDSLAK